MQCFSGTTWRPLTVVAEARRYGGGTAYAGCRSHRALPRIPPDGASAPRRQLDDAAHRVARSACRRSSSSRQMRSVGRSTVETRLTLPSKRYSSRREVCCLTAPSDCPRSSRFVVRRFARLPASGVYVSSSFSDVFVKHDPETALNNCDTPINIYGLHKVCSNSIQRDKIRPTTPSQRRRSTGL